MKILIVGHSRKVDIQQKVLKRRVNRNIEQGT